MTEITKKFFSSSSIPKTQTSTAIMDFLSSPESVCKMVIVTDLGLPAIAGVVKELEEKFADSDDFPFSENYNHENIVNRRNLGWMVRFVMREYGYTPRKRGFIEDDYYCGHTRVPSFTKSQYLTSGAIYLKTIEHPNFKLNIDTINAK